MPNVGDLAPDFTLPSTRGEPRSLKDLRGRKVLLYFYPKDNTPGCTQEACDFRDNLDRLSAAGVVIIGISKDSLKSHQNFRHQHALPFELLTDADNSVATAYGAYGPKKMYGKQVMGTIRSTFLLDEEGRVIARFSPVTVEGHVQKVLEALANA